jgi:hypothetical protein
MPPEENRNGKTNGYAYHEHKHNHLTCRERVLVTLLFVHTEAVLKRESFVEWVGSDQHAVTTANPHVEQKEPEVSIVIVADAVVHPRAVVVHL